MAKPEVRHVVGCCLDFQIGKVIKCTYLLRQFNVRNWIKSIQKLFALILQITLNLPRSSTPWFSPIYYMQQNVQDTVECVSDCQMLQKGYDDTNECYERKQYLNPHHNLAWTRPSMPCRTFGDIPTESDRKPYQSDELLRDRCEVDHEGRLVHFSTWDRHRWLGAGSQRSPMRNFQRAGK